MKLKKILTSLMLASALGMTSINICAQELPVLDLKKAITSAVNTSGDVPVYEKQMKASQEVADDTPDVSSMTYKQNLIQKEAYGRKITYTKDAITYDVTTLYNEMALLKEKIAFTDKKIALKEKILKQSELKYNKGIMSKLEYELEQSQFEELKNSKVELEASLEEKRVKFNTLAKYDINQYTLEKNFDTEYYRYVGNVQRYFRETVDDIFKYDQEIAELQDDYAGRNAVSEDNQFSYSLYYTGKANAANGLNSLETQKKNLIDSWNTTYSNMISTEQKIKDLENSIVDQEKKLATQRIKAEQGYVAEIEIEKLEMDIEEMKLNISECKVNYNAMKDVIKKPWVVVY